MRDFGIKAKCLMRICFMVPGLGFGVVWHFRAQGRKSGTQASWLLRLTVSGLGFGV